MRVASIGLTPVKGTRHQALDAVDLRTGGPVGDRVFALVDPGRRQVLRTVAHGSLLQATVAWDEPVLTATLAGRVASGVPEPTGETLDVDYWGRRVRVDVVGGPWAELFSRHLGQAVVLARARPGDVVYGDQVSVVTTASLTALRATSRGTTDVRPLDLADSARFRSTFVLDTAGSPYDRPGAEDDWVGRELLLGEARVRLSAPIVRCAVVELHPVDGHRDLRLLDGLPRDAAGQPVFGLQGRVVQPGRVHRGSAARISP
jgi:uncharacterized protein YcbX